MPSKNKAKKPAANKPAVKKKVRKTKKTKAPGTLSPLKRTFKKPKKEKKQKPIILRPLESTQQNVPVKEFYNGMIITKDNRYIKILEVKPSTFMLMSTSDQNSLISRFRYVLRVCPMNTQFSEITLPGDLKDQIETVDMNLAIEKNKSCLEIGHEYRNLLEDAQNYGLKRRFFLSFEYEREGAKNIFAKDNLDDISRWMNITAQNIIDSLKACGNEVVVPEPGEENNYLAEILYSFYYRSSIKMAPFEEHAFDVMRPYYQKFGTTKTQLSAVEYLAPKSMAFLNSKYVVVNNNTYYTFAYIPSNGYRTAVQAGWLTMFINTYPGVGVSVFLERVSKDYVISSIRKNIVWNEMNMGENSGISAAYESASNAAAAGDYLREGIAEGEDFYYMSVLITISGDSPEEVSFILKELQKIAKQRDFKLVEAKFREEQAFNSVLPLSNLDRSLYMSSRRNILLDGACAAYPFTTFELNDKEGIYLGTDKTTGSVVTLDLFDTKKYANANAFICGMSGKGKTYTMLLFAIRMRINHIPVFIIAPEKEHEFERICKALGGQFIQLGAGTKDRINIMEIFKRDESVVDESMANKSYLLAKASSLKKFVKLLYPDMSMAERAYLDDAIIKTYEKFGITQDNESLIDPRNPTQFKKMPILSDLQEQLSQIAGAEKMVSIIKMMTTGSGKSFNGPTTIDTSNEFTVIGLESMSADEMLPVGIFMAMDFMWSKIKEDRTKKKALFIDEWWKLGFNAEGAEYSVEIAKTIRAYGGAMILATQQMKDITTVENGKYGEQVLGNCVFKVLMGMEKQDADAVRRIVGITDAEAEQVKMFDKGEGLLLASDCRIPIKFEGTKAEHHLITTDRSELAEQSRRIKEQREEEERIARIEAQMKIRDDKESRKSDSNTETRPERQQPSSASSRYRNPNRYSSNANPTPNIESDDILLDDDNIDIDFDESAAEDDIVELY